MSSSPPGLARGAVGPARVIAFGASNVAPAPAETKRNGGSSRRRVAASADTPGKQAEATRKDRAR